MPNPVDAEQAHLSTFYAALDAERAKTEQRTADELLISTRNAQALNQRDHRIRNLDSRLSRLNRAEEGLYFGRLDAADGEVLHIGRLGLHDADYEPLLIDWRAPAARPFYIATAVANQGVVRRRHIQTRLRRVIDVQDEQLDLGREAADPSKPGTGVIGEAVLLKALDARRTGRMESIVQTIQADQDRIIRSELPGILVVQGGPGTGKTAIALHRAAYLLYTHREQLEKRGILVVGPNAAFLRFIGQVLPSLGEDGVRLVTIAELYPGLTATRPEAPESAAVKGRAVMAQVIAKAVADRQWVPAEPVELTVDRTTLTVDPAYVEAARDRARSRNLTHNQARPFFVTELIDWLTNQYSDLIGTDPLDGENLLDEYDLAELRKEILAEPTVHALLDQLWPQLSPQQLLEDLYGDERRLAEAAPQLSELDREHLLRYGADWSPADVPLLDEAAELLGDDGTEAARERAARARAVAYAQGALDVLSGSGSTDFDEDDDSEMLTAKDILDAAMLAERYEADDDRTLAERAGADRRWTYGHVIVDEAQELSPMAWRAIARRCPLRSMTVVGDVAQTSAIGGGTSWSSALGETFGDRWRLAELTLNYRTPAEVMELANDVLREVDPTAKTPRSVRSTGVQPWHADIPAAEQALYVYKLASEETQYGAVGVITSRSRLELIQEAVDGLSGVTVLTARDAKGLEFDSVLVVDPDGIVIESPRGLRDLYVALTRCTQRLGVVGELPDVLRESRAWAQ
ncbi:AAA family ATPase [Kribbella sandramycini]|uniref:AAA family ATPase n=1 Tax=Kribbella sandramycini TaxID=60450 RepID=A0A7Y4KZS0_9ACTN|nr:AAA family ATPase [Kribbella sandramycini]MBB6565415.1 DNA helicase IV [Kribbella sandramycini]NOL41683.1 AAA family ATPase [Kribbella sandramycini]